MTIKQILFFSLSLFSLIGLSDPASAQHFRGRRWCVYDEGGDPPPRIEEKIDRMEAECDADSPASDKRACRNGVLWLRQYIGNQTLPPAQGNTKFYVELILLSMGGCERGEGQGEAYVSCVRGIELAWMKRNLPYISYNGSYWPLLRRP